MILVTGAGGFIGTHLVRRLKAEGHYVRGVDIKTPEWSTTEADEFFLYDLRHYHYARQVVRDARWIFHLAADMGGMGFISTKQADIISNNTAININMLRAARSAQAAYPTNTLRFLFSSSACIYPMYRQAGESPKPLREEDAYPAQPQESYGWEKLHMEHLCQAYQEAGWLDTRIVRFHNCFGPLGSWEGGREKAPAALSRKIAIAKLTGDPRVEIWGDGGAVRTYMYIDDCIEGILRLMHSNYTHPVNLGRNVPVTVDGLADLIATIAGIKIEKVHISGPEGVRWRNSDNRLCRAVLGWEPEIPLEVGLVPTYNWIEGHVRRRLDA